MTSCSGGLINVKIMLRSRWFRHSVFGQVHPKTREMLSISNKCFIFSRSSKNWLRDFGGWVVPGFVCAVVRNRSPPAEAIRNERDFGRQGKQASGNVKSEFPTPGKDNWSWKVGHVRTSLKDCNFKWWKLNFEWRWKSCFWWWFGRNAYTLSNSIMDALYRFDWLWSKERKKLLVSRIFTWRLEPFGETAQFYLALWRWPKWRLGCYSYFWSSKCIRKLGRSSRESEQRAIPIFSSSVVKYRKSTRNVWFSKCWKRFRIRHGSCSKII